MSKKFNFKLNAVKKIREFAEFKAKVSLGITNQKILSLEEELQTNTFYQTQLGEELNDKAISNRLSPEDVYLTQYLDKSLRRKRQMLEEKEQELLNEREEKLNDLYFRMKEVEVFNNMEKKKKKQFQHRIEKKEDDEIQDLIIIGHGNRRNE